MYKHAVRPFTEEVARNAWYKLQRAGESKVTKCFAEQRRRVETSGLNVLASCGWREHRVHLAGATGLNIL